MARESSCTGSPYPSTMIFRILHPAETKHPVELIKRIPPKTRDITPRIFQFLLQCKMSNYLLTTEREMQMRKSLLVVLMIVVALILVACETADTSTQATSAQSLQPNITGFRIEEGDNVVQSFANVVAGATAVTGNVPLAATIERVNATIACLGDVGAVSAQVYVQEQNVQLVPQAGMSFVVNKTRVERNILGCVADTQFSAQAVLDIEPCAQTGTFTYQNEEFYYAYIGAGTELCSGFSQHFNTYSPTIENR